MAGGDTDIGRSFQGEFFGDQKPSFALPDMRTDRIGVIDVGSNSVRLVVFDGQSRSPTTLFNEKVMCGLGAGLHETGRLDPEGRARALRALTRFAALAPGLGVGALAAIGTAAVREAEDGPEFCAEIAEATGIRLRVATGQDEARLAARGVAFGNPSATGVVVDLGGGSLEFCHIEDGEVGQGLSTPLGPLRLSAAEGRGSDVDAEIRRYLDTLTESFRLSGGRLYLVGGAWRALVRVEMARTGYPLHVLHEYRLPADQAAALAEWAANADPRKLVEMPGVPSGRVKTIPYAGRLLGHLIAVLEPGDLQISAFGLREGVCLENLSRALRAQDPLLSACREQELRRGRAPGFGDELAEWAVAAIGPEDPDEARLIRAAAILSDVNWRTHPDYRTQGCWETVTRSSLTDLGHEGRIFLGSALVVRHRSSRKAIEGNGALSLLPEARKERARRVGLTLRLGAAIAGAAPGPLRHAVLKSHPDRLELCLSGPGVALAGEAVEKRLANLARALERDHSITVAG